MSIGRLVAIFGLVFATIGASVALPLQAEIDAPDKVDSRSSFTVDVSIAGWPADTVLAGFSFDLVFTTGPVGFVEPDSSFTGALGVVPLEAIGAVQFSQDFTTKLTIALVSLLPEAELAALQDDAFLLYRAAFVPFGGFTGIQIAGFSARNFVLTDAFGTEILPDRPLFASTSVLIAPEPVSLALVLSGLLLVTLRRRG
jgi:hypothetical protein